MCRNLQPQGVNGHCYRWKTSPIWYYLYIKHNLFHQSKLGRNAELQNTHVVLFKSPQDLHQVATISVQLGLGSAFVDWYRNATSVPFGHFLIDLTPRRDHRLRYWKNSVVIPSKFFVPDNLKHLKFFDDGHLRSFYSPSFPKLFLSMKISVSKYYFKRNYQISQRLHRLPAARKLVRSKKKSRPKVQRRNSRTGLNKNNLKKTMKSTFVSKRIFAHKNNFPLRH